jgi:hypothetical protein
MGLFSSIMRKKVIYICGRENLSDDAIFHAKLVAYLQSLGFCILEESGAKMLKDRIPIAVMLLKHLGIFYLLRLIFHSSRTLLNRYQSKANVEKRISRLRLYLQLLDWENIELYVLGRSAGAIVASRLAMEFPVKAVIALGYPFIHPEYGMQSYRVEHLAHVKQEMYIFQGIRDEYGNPEMITSIAMSSFVQIIPLVTDHAFVLEDDKWEQFTSHLSSIIS